jgi:hypothetical protein
MENNIIDITPEKKSCKKCSSSAKNFAGLPISMIIFAIYFLFSSVYGTIEIIKNIISLF